MTCCCAERPVRSTSTFPAFGMNLRALYGLFSRDTWNPKGLVIALGSSCPQSVRRQMADATTPPSAPTNEFEDDGTRPTLFRTVTRSTISTMATADNLPGPGRTVGNLLKTWGDKVEDVFAELNANRLRRRGPDAHGASASATNMAPLRRTATIYTISTNATADNLPGPGRNVGLLFGWIGGHLEVRLGRVM